ncbi:hypothetical protein J2W68_002488 [Luteimonas terrae]|uniref:Uncharacterized protein n=1 Tax=Luteimonas terrae TaxID=1530191 RepID=A0ABU1Y0C3_9GAMM|nr:hypothetical protein [Luteimonas terrae]
MQPLRTQRLRGHFIVFRLQSMPRIAANNRNRNALRTNNRARPRRVWELAQQ